MDSKQIKYKDGCAWYNGDDLFHRTDGPAIIYYNGNKYWYVNGRELTFDEWCDHLGVDEKTRTFLRLKYV